MKELDALPIFAKVVELKSFAEAARQLNLPTTTVSRKIHKLEAELGGKLLNRTTRSLSLTELGEGILPKAQLIQDTLLALISQADEFSTQPTGKLSVSAPRALCQSLLAPILCAFRNQYPGIKIELEAANRVQDLAGNNVDFAFRVGKLSDSSLIAMPISQVNYELVAHPMWLDKTQDLTHPEDLGQFPSIRNHVEGYILPWLFHRNGESYNHEAEADLLSNDLHVSLAYAEAGLGLAYLPVSLVRPSIENGTLVSLLSDWDKQEHHIYLVYQNREHLPQKSRLFMDFIKTNQSLFSKQLAW